ncbi:MAG: vanomycin resistance protein VanB [Gaiellaceae bacterium]|nr:vanomycin resistance protein VanB [Gaiellaceae bacterium]
MKRRPLIAAATLVALAVVATGALAARDAAYRDRPLPGVTVREVALDRPIEVRVGAAGHALRPETVLGVDEAATAARARERGRGSFLTRLRALADPSPPELTVDPVLVREGGLAAFVERAERGLRKPVPARVSLAGVRPSRPGDEIDREAFFGVLEDALLHGRGSLRAPLRRVQPERTTAAAEEALETARAVVAAPVELAYRGERIGSLAPRRLARLVRFVPRRDHFVVTFDKERLSAAVRPALRPWRKRATNARFLVANGGVRIRPSKPGLDVSVNAAVREVTAAAYSQQRVAELALRETAADLTTREAEALGIRERISTFTTEMGPSSANRIHNVHLMAEYIDGTLLRPGETFSFNDSVGPRTEERGFREGQMIIGSLLLPSIGGGVCQTATTLFNNAWELGLPILERYNHSFYISHYPMGRDATVAWGGPDFAFRNDLDTGILITTSYTDDTLTFSFWGTDPRRRIVTETGPQVNWRTPTTTYALDPYAPAGSVRTVSGSNQMGFDVTVSRTVFEGGKKLRSDSVTSHYIAVGPTSIYGPGRTIPGPYFVLPRV